MNGHRQTGPVGPVRATEVVNIYLASDITDSSDYIRDPGIHTG
jgi:hypothetical protein